MPRLEVEDLPEELQEEIEEQEDGYHEYRINGPKFGDVHIIKVVKTGSATSIFIHNSY